MCLVIAFHLFFADNKTQESFRTRQEKPQLELQLITHINSKTLIQKKWKLGYVM